MSGVRVRAATAGDVDAVVATSENLLEDMFGPRPIVEALIGEIDGEAEGFALFFHNYSTWVGRRGIYLEDLYVRPSSRGRGLGKALLAEVAATAQRRNCQRVDWMVLDWNESARAFYRSLGADAMEEWTMFRLKGDAIRRVAEHA
jgi:GNAT superfamily N-acetyltransferase